MKYIDDYLSCISSTKLTNTWSWQHNYHQAYVTFSSIPKSVYVTLSQSFPNLWFRQDLLSVTTDLLASFSILTLWELLKNMSLPAKIKQSSYRETLWLSSWSLHWRICIPHTSVCVLAAPLPADGLGKQESMAQMLGPLLPRERLGRSIWLWTVQAIMGEWISKCEIYLSLFSLCYNCISKVNK